MMNYLTKILSIFIFNRLVYADNVNLNILTNKYVSNEKNNLARSTINENEVKLYLSDSPRIYMTEPTTEKYQLFNLLNRRLEFDIDLSNVPCDYNFALYFSEMSWCADAVNGKGYCDAQGQGYSCNELDIIETNKQSAHLASHSCQNGACDKDGNFAKFYYRDSNIDVFRPFKIVTEFIMQGDSFTNIKQYYMQDNNVVGPTLNLFENGVNGGLAEMKNAFSRGMVLIISLWTSGPDGLFWLNGKCERYEVYNDISGIIRNIKISNL